jgi:NAD+ synthase (glutamine-hydrolysing)
VERFDTVSFHIDVPSTQAMPLQRKVARFPYVPSDPRQRDERCMEVYNIQVQALVQRLSSSKISKVVIGVSGGLDSTHALLVCAKAMDRLGLPARTSWPIRCRALPRATARCSRRAN